MVSFGSQRIHREFLICGELCNSVLNIRCAATVYCRQSSYPPLQQGEEMMPSVTFNEGLHQVIIFSVRLSLILT